MTSFSEPPAAASHPVPGAPDGPGHGRGLAFLDDDPVTLPERLEAAWSSGQAAVVGAPDATLPDPLSGPLSGPVPPGTALVVPTSGSTGTPRAVILSRAALAASTAASLAALGCRPGERWVLALPVRHVAGLQVLARARALGSAPHVLDDPGDPHGIAAASAHAQHIALVPTQLVRCLEAGVDLSGYASVLVGGGPLAPERAAAARAAGVTLVQSYGMTETCGGCVYDGRPLAGVEIAIEHDRATSGDTTHDGAGHATTRGTTRDTTVGRIRLRGPMLATGYLAASAVDAARFTSDGWFVTDDLGRLRTAADGTPLLEVVGRGDDVIITGGVKVVPGTVEDALRHLPSVRDVVVLGVADPEWGERVRAVVVPTDPAQPPTLELLRAAADEHLPAAHAPRELVLVEHLARDGLGKLSAAERDRLRR